MYHKYYIYQQCIKVKIKLQVYCLMPVLKTYRPTLHFTPPPPPPPPGTQHQNNIERRETYFSDNSAPSGLETVHQAAILTKHHDGVGRVLGFGSGYLTSYGVFHIQLQGRDLIIYHSHNAGGGCD